jgi:hypothetical protein
VRRALFLGILFFAACQPRVYHRTVEGVVSADRDVMRCALGESSQLGYEIREDDPQEGTSWAQRELAQAGNAPSRFDVLTFDFVGEIAASKTFRVSAVTLVHGGGGRGPHYLDPTAGALADRDRVVAICVNSTR